MTKFDLLVFIDDDDITNAFHEIIVEVSDLCKTAIFINDPLKGIAYFQNILEMEDKLPQVLFLDINMPKMNGWEFIEALKKVGLKQLPIIIILSTSDYDKDIERSKTTAEVYKYLNKPLAEGQLEELFEELKPILSP